MHIWQFECVFKTPLFRLDWELVLLANILVIINTVLIEMYHMLVYWYLLNNRKWSTFFLALLHMENAHKSLFSKENRNTISILEWQMMACPVFFRAWGLLNWDEPSRQKNMLFRFRLHKMLKPNMVVPNCLKSSLKVPYIFGVFTLTKLYQTFNNFLLRKLCSWNKVSIVP